MIEFPSVEEAQSYYKSDEFQQVMKETVGNTVEDVFESQWRCVSGAEGFEAKPDGKGYWVVSVLDFINDDELVELTPKSLRIRKKLLCEIERKRDKKNAQ